VLTTAFFVIILN